MGKNQKTEKKEKNIKIKQKTGMIGLFPKPIKGQY